MNRILFLLVFFFASINVKNLLPQWKDISPIGRRERIYSLNLKSSYFDSDCSSSFVDFDTILAVGWSSSNGAYFLSFDGGENWSIWTDNTFFPFSGIFTSENKILVVGYNFIFDNAELKIFDTYGNQLERFQFDGDNLPLIKSFFDCFEKDEFFYAVGYGGSIFRFDKLNRTWDQIIIDSNIVGIKLKKFLVRNGSYENSLLCILGGKSFQISNRIYILLDNLEKCELIYDFRTFSEGAEVNDFHFYGLSSDGFPLGYAVGVVFDTIVVWRSNDHLGVFEKVFERQSFDQPISVYSFENGKNVVVLFDNGGILFSSDYGKNWDYEQIPSAKQLTGGIIFCQSKSEPTYLHRELKFYGYGRDGFISTLSKEKTLGFFEKESKISIYDEVEVFDLLGNLVFRVKIGVPTEEIIKNLPRGIYYIAKKLNKYFIEIKGVINF